MLTDRCLSENLKQIRIDKGVSLERVSIFLDVQKRTIMRYESGERTPDLATLIKLTYLFNCELIDFLKNTDDTEGFVPRERVLSYRDIVEQGYNTTLAHGLIKEIVENTSFDDRPKVDTADKKIKFVYKEEMRELLEKLLEELC